MVKKHGFVLTMLVYALVFLLAAGLGLRWFWGCMEAYEASRSTTAIRAYMESLTREHLCSNAESLYEQIDEKLQSRELFNQVILRSLSEEFTYAKNSAESNALRQVYMISSGEQVIGSVVLTPGNSDQYGFHHWKVSDEQFDFSYLMGKAVSITVPEDFSVSINGNLLDGSYITAEIPYPALEPFHGQFPMPMLITYSAEHFLGNPALEVLDREGRFVAISSETDMDSFLPQCSEAKKTELDEFLWEFLTRYIAFTGSSNRAAGYDYLRLVPYMVSQGALAKRLYSAIDGLSFAQSRGDELNGVEIHRYASLGENRYLCDLSFTVTTLGQAGAVRTVSDLKLVILDTEYGLKVEYMEMY